MTPVEQAIRNADIPKDFATQTGDCGSIALAIQDVFGGDLIGVYNTEHQHGPSHVAVRINNRLYDGDGRTSLPVLYARFVMQDITPAEDDQAIHRATIEAPDELAYSQAARETIRDRLFAEI